MSLSASSLGSIPSCSARERIRLNAAVADSFITSPIWPVRVMLPLPGMRRGLDEEDFAADGRVGHARRDAGHAGAAGQFRLETAAGRGLC